jgi:hypothetical protein
VKHLSSKVLVCTLLASLAVYSQSLSAKTDECGHDSNSLVRLETLAKESGPFGVTARSALRYVAQQKLPTSGYYISRSPIASAGGKIEYHLVHESGFKNPCYTVGNRSGLDGVLEVDGSTHEVKQFLMYQ